MYDKTTRLKTLNKTPKLAANATVYNCKKNKYLYIREIPTNKYKIQPALKTNINLQKLTEQRKKEKTLTPKNFENTNETKLTKISRANIKKLTTLKRYDNKYTKGTYIVMLNIMQNLYQT